MTQPSLNVANLNRLIAHMEAQPPERINMAFVDVVYREGCGTCGCIAGHAEIVVGRRFNLPVDDLGHFLGLNEEQAEDLATPSEFWNESAGVIRYPASRVLRTLRHLRDHYLATNEIVVDWGAEPGEDPKVAWAPPKVVSPELPDELTRFLAEPVPVTATTGA